MSCSAARTLLRLQHCAQGFMTGFEIVCSDFCPPSRPFLASRSSTCPFELLSCSSSYREMDRGAAFFTFSWTNFVERPERQTRDVSTPATCILRAAVKVVCFLCCAAILGVRDAFGYSGSWLVSSLRYVDTRCPTPAVSLAVDARTCARGYNATLMISRPSCFDVSVNESMGSRDVGTKKSRLA
jgi:hypothetical protein